MATTRQFENSPYGYIVLRRSNGSQVNVSAKTDDRTAVILMTNSAQALIDANPGRLVPMPEILEIAENIVKLVNKKNSPTVEAIPYLRGLLGEHTDSESHLVTKERVIDLLEGVLDARPKAGMRDITPDDVGKFKSAIIALGLGDSTLRKYLDTLGGMLETAFRRGIVDENVVRLVSKPARPKNSPRRPFTDEELQKAFAVANEEWRGMMMVAMYTGLRLGDISRLVFRDIDLVRKHIRAAVKKGRSFEDKPIPNPLLRYFQSLEWPADLDQPLFSRAYKWATTGCRSISRIADEFIKLLIVAGVRTPEQRQGHQQRQGAEKYAPLSFHCLRHNFTTMLKKSRVSEAIARRIGGHRSVAVSDVYTHLGEDVMLDAVQNVPVVIDVSARVAKETVSGASIPSITQAKGATTPKRVPDAA